MLSRTNKRINYLKYIIRKPYKNFKYPVYYAYGRTALQIGMNGLNLKKNSHILVPEYICKEVIAAIQKLKFKVLYYPVLIDLKPDWNYLEKMKLNNVSAILMVHYFGVPQEIENFLAFKNKNNLFLIEDNSHGFGGLYKNKNLGTFGDIGFSSPRKSLPILNGGILYSQSNSEIKNFNNLENFSILALTLGALIKRDKLSLFKNTESVSAPFCIDFTSYKYIKGLNLDFVRNKRSKIYNLWTRWSKENNLTPLYKLNTSLYCPLYFPIVTKNFESHSYLKKLFKNENIAFTIWPNLPNNLPKISTAHKLRDSIICLPIHIGMNLKCLKKRLSKIKISN